jgi:phospholipid/cholesterol/gamma-HCH transport system substrate-binding protein
MEPRVSYALVGLFVLVFTGAFVALVFWLVGVEPAADYRTYAVYPPESVAGIGGETPVKYQGVDVGKVRQVGLDPHDPRRVRLLVDVRREVPIKVDTTASLASQGLTGLVYFIELRGGEAESAALEAAPGADYPVIRAELSELTQLQRTGTELLEQGRSAAAELRDTLVAVRNLIAGDERAAVGTVIEDAGRTAARLAQAAETLNSLLDRLSPLLDDLTRAAARLPGLAEHADQMVHSVGEAAIRVDQTAQRLGDLTVEAGPGLRTLTRDGMPELAALLKDLHRLAGRLDRLAAELEQQPNLLLYDRARRPGPGEVR